MAGKLSEKESEGPLKKQGVPKIQEEIPVFFLLFSACHSLRQNVDLSIASDCQVPMGANDKIVSVFKASGTGRGQGAVVSRGCDEPRPWLYPPTTLNAPQLSSCFLVPNTGTNARSKL